MSRWTRFVDRRRDSREKWDDLDDVEKIERLRKNNRALSVALVALIVAGGFAALLFRLNDLYLAERAKLRNDQAQTVACALIYEAQTNNPYVIELIEDNPTCPLPSRLVPFGPKPSTSPATPSPTPAPTSSRGSQVQSPVSPTLGPTGSAVRPGAGESRGRTRAIPARTNTATAPRTATSPARTTPGGAGGTSTTPTPLLCVDLPLGPLRTRIGC